MATSTAKSILSDTSKHNKPGGRAKANLSFSRRRGAGNKGSLGLKKNSSRPSINSGGNYGVLGY